MDFCIPYEEVIEYLRKYDQSFIRARAMTLIAALIESKNSILIASDGEFFESGVVRLHREDKLKRHPKAPLVWGCSGNLQIGSDLSNWIMNSTGQSDKWETLKYKIIRKLATLNGLQRKLTRMSGTEIKDDHLCNYLLVGWINGTPDIIEFDMAGRVSSYLKPEFHSIGVGFSSAYVICETLNRMGGISPERKIKLIIDVVMDMVPLCGKPRTVLRVTPHGIADISKD